MSINRDLADSAAVPPFRKNLIINGGMSIWQRGVSFTAPTSGDYTADRWRYINNTTGVVNIAKVVLDGGIGNDYLSVDVTTTDASMAAADIAAMEQYIEGNNSAALAYGSSAAKTITISFWTAHTKTGTYCAALRNNAGDRSYVAEYTQAVADTWEYHTVTIPGDVAGTWIDNNGIGLRISFTFASGTNFETTPDAWNAGNFLATTNQVNALDNTANFFRFTAVKLEVGTESTDFEYRPFGEELALCQRYYEKSYDIDIFPGNTTRSGSSYARVPVTGSFWADHHITFKVAKAGTPTLTYYATDSGTIDRMRNVTTGADLGVNLAQSGLSNFVVRHTATITAGNETFLHWTADAEL